MTLRRVTLLLLLALGFAARAADPASRPRPQLPIPLTPEEDDRLVAEGVLPPLDRKDDHRSRYTYNYTNCPLGMVMQSYAALAGRTVVGAERLTVDITLCSEEQVTREQMLADISNALARAGVVMDTATNGVITVRLATNAPAAHAEPPPSSGGALTPEEWKRIRMQAGAAETNPPPVPTKYSGAELSKRLSEYKLQVIRAGLPPLPIPLTEEEGSRLAAEGIAVPTNIPANKWTNSADAGETPRPR